MVSSAALEWDLPKEYFCFLLEHRLPGASAILAVAAEKVGFVAALGAVKPLEGQNLARVAIYWPLVLKHEYLNVDYMFVKLSLIHI